MHRLWQVLLIVALVFASVFVYDRFFYLALHKPSSSELFRSQFYENARSELLIRCMTIPNASQPISVQAMEINGTPLVPIISGDSSHQIVAIYNDLSSPLRAFPTIVGCDGISSEAIRGEIPVNNFRAFSLMLSVNESLSARTYNCTLLAFPGAQEPYATPISIRVFAIPNR